MNCKYFRNIRTMNERRQVADPTMYGYARAKRRGHNLPNAWDDIMKGRKKVPTRRQLNQSRQGYHNSIRYMVVD